MSESTLFFTPPQPAAARHVPVRYNRRLEAGLDARQLIPPDALRCAVPVSMGGLGGAPAELSPFIRRLCETSPSAALLFWAQRMAIEFLVHADNVALREFLMPDFLTFHKSATVPFNFEHKSLHVGNDGRHLYLSGGHYVVTNAQADGFTLICPITTDEGSLAWCVADSEAQGFECVPHDIGTFALNAKAARIEMRNVFFRGDELLGEASLATKVLEVQSALGVIYEDLLSSQHLI